MSEVNYKKLLNKWADRRNFSVAVTTEYENFPGKEGRMTACVRCNNFNLCLFVDSEDEETVEQCEQRAARKFLQTYGRTQVGLHN